MGNGSQELLGEQPSDSLEILLWTWPHGRRMQIQQGISQEWTPLAELPVPHLHMYLLFLSCQTLYPKPSTGAGCLRDQIRTRESKIANRARVLYAPRKAKSRPWPVAEAQGPKPLADPCARQKVRYQVLEPEPSLKSCGQRCQDKGERDRKSQATVSKAQGYKALSRKGLEHSLWTIGL